MAGPATFVSHLECSRTGERLPPDRLYNLSAAGAPLLVRYDLAGLRSVDRDAVAARPGGFWRYRELLPVRRDENVVSLGEVTTPLVRLGEAGEVLVKDESRLPTASFKARGLALAVAMARELGVARMAMPSNGNAGAALAAYAARAGIASLVLCPDDTPEAVIREIAMQGARVYRVNGYIHECAALIGQGARAGLWFDTSTLKEPYRIEGKKTMGIELAEQFGWRLPEAIFYPTGGGTGLIGMWKVFAELRELGWIEGPLPRMIAVQAEGCAPIVRAFAAGADKAEPWVDAATLAWGIRVPAAIGDFLILRAVRESGGFAAAVSDAAIAGAQAEVARRDGLLLGPEGAATYAAWRDAVASGRIARDARVVLFNCGSALKYPLPPAGHDLDRHNPPDLATL